MKLLAELKKVDWRNYKMWIALAAIIPLMFQAIGVDLLPANYNSLVNTFLTLFVTIGILTNPQKVPVPDVSVEEAK